MAAVAFWLQPAVARADRNVTFTTTQGTWMSVDVSPDGKTIVFDLLGDLYTVPIAGGTATRITEGRAFDSQPRWAPDGRSIAFASDRSGSDNLWIADADGKNPRAVTSDKDGGITAPAWTADGEYLVARKDPTLNRRGSAELWLYPKSGGAGLVLVKRTAGGGLNPNGPVVSRDGRWVYFAHGNRVLDSTWGAWQLWRLDRRSGDVAPITTGYHGAVRPALSPDGRYVAYVRRNHARSALVLRDVESGAERDLFTDLDRDDQRGTTDYDAYPGFGFTPDGKSIVIASGGQHPAHLRRRRNAGGDSVFRAGLAQPRRSSVLSAAHRRRSGRCADHPVGRLHARQARRLRNARQDLDRRWKRRVGETDAADDEHDASRVCAGDLAGRQVDRVCHLG